MSRDAVRWWMVGNLAFFFGLFVPSLFGLAYPDAWKPYLVWLGAPLYLLSALLQKVAEGRAR